MIFTAGADGGFDLAGRRVRCALGCGGVVAASVKREGDGATPLGDWAIRRVLYRPDRLERPQTTLPAAPIQAEDGWCDDPGDRAYNRPVRLPYAARHERLWREDGLYDLVCVLAHNDDPPIAGLGSAIFLHCARDDYGSTQGCVALARSDLQALLALATPGSALRVVAAAPAGPI